MRTSNIVYSQGSYPLRSSNVIYSHGQTLGASYVSPYQVYSGAPVRQSYTAAPTQYQSVRYPSDYYGERYVTRTEPIVTRTYANQSSKQVNFFK